MKKHAGFTLIELLIVVSVMGALAGIIIRVINPEKQKAIAEDAVKQNYLMEVVEGIETYRVAEGSYPAEGSNNNPLDSSASTDDLAAVYLSEWPAGLVYNLSSNNFSVHVRKSTDNDFFKYTSTWKEIRECGETTDPNSVSDCD